jgi:hypothetical protein
VDLPGEFSLAQLRRPMYIGAIALSVGALLVVLTVFWLRRARRAAAERVVPAHEWALEELRRLWAEGLVEQGDVHAFYFRLTWIVRRYIELRFGIMAAEQTTREFFEEARTHPSLGGTYRELLSEFLTAGDLVKFALHMPEASEIEGAFEAAREFVAQTALPTSGAVQGAAA